MDAMFEVKSSAGQVLINEGEKGDNFYIVQGAPAPPTLPPLPAVPALPPVHPLASRTPPCLPYTPCLPHTGGSYQVFLKKLPGKPVKTYNAGDSFGELALLCALLTYSLTHLLT